MGKLRIKRLKREVEITLKSKNLYQQYKSVIKLQSHGIARTEACMRVGIPRSKFYYWHRKVCRVLRLKIPGSHISVSHFREISSRPKFSPRKTPVYIEQYILDIRRETNQGAEFIQYELITKHGINLSITGIYKCLKRNGLIRERKYHQKKRLVYIKRSYAPGEKLQVDTKYVKMIGKTFYQYSAIDMATGIIFKWLYENIGPDESCDFLRKLVNFFPFRINSIQTDNGLEYTWRLHPEIKQTHHFTLQCKLLQIDHVLIPPASPTFNSKVERTHRIDKEELWNTRQFKSYKSMQKALRAYVHRFNHLRKTPTHNWHAPINYANLNFGLNISILRLPVQKV
jgi:transposase-like protein